MIEVEAKLRKWGRSFGVVIPMDKVREANLVENESIIILITKDRNPFLESFGMLKTKKTTKQILKDIRKGAWDD